MQTERDFFFFNVFYLMGIFYSFKEKEVFLNKEFFNKPRVVVPSGQEVEALEQMIWPKDQIQRYKGIKRFLTMNFQMFNLVLEKAEKPKVKLPTSAGSSKKQ